MKYPNLQFKKISESALISLSNTSSRETVQLRTVRTTVETIQLCTFIQSVHNKYTESWENQNMLKFEAALMVKKPY